LATIFGRSSKVKAKSKSNDVKSCFLFAIFYWDYALT